MLWFSCCFETTSPCCAAAHRVKRLEVVGTPCDRAEPLLPQRGSSIAHNSRRPSNSIPSAAASPVLGRQDSADSDSAEMSAIPPASASQCTEEDVQPQVASASSEGIQTGKDVQGMLDSLDSELEQVSHTKSSDLLARSSSSSWSIV